MDEMQERTATIQQVLAARAKRLAEPEAPPPPVDVLEVVEFALGRERYAVEAHTVEEVFRLTSRSALPGAPQPIAGITAHRGDLLTLLDLRGPLGLHPGALDDLGRVVVLRRGATRVGLLVDRVEGIRTIRREELEAPDLPPQRPEFFLGVTPEVIAVLDTDAIVRSFDGEERL